MYLDHLDFWFRLYGSVILSGDGIKIGAMGKWVGEDGVGCGMALITGGSGAAWRYTGFDEHVTSHSSWIAREQAGSSTGIGALSPRLQSGRSRTVHLLSSIRASPQEVTPTSMVGTMLAMNFRNYSSISFAPFTTSEVERLTITR